MVAPAEIDRVTTPIGLFNQAEAYWLSAGALREVKVRSGSASYPIRFLYHHAAELYLKAFLREHGHSVGDLQNTYRHDFRRMRKRARKLGLFFEPEDNATLQFFVRTPMASFVRYTTRGYYTIPTEDALANLCSNLRHRVGKALQDRGQAVRL